MAGVLPYGMSLFPITHLLRAFDQRSYRFQWPADLLVSWAFEMETLILSWFVLVVTDSVVLTASFAALQFGGTLLSPLFGVVADRVERRHMLIAMRLAYAFLAAIIMVLGLLDEIAPWQLFVVAGFSGLIRPSDLVVRHSLIADTFEAHRLPNAMGLSRTTMDTARIAGSLLGAGLLSTLGIGMAYGAVVGFYLSSAIFSLGINVKRVRPPRETNPWQELRLGVSYMWQNATIVSIMALAFLVNLTAFPITHGLLPVVARNVFGLDENGLARLVASYAVGALVGSIALAGIAGRRPGRWTLVATLLWYLLLIAFSQVTTAGAGTALIVLIGAAQSCAMISMSVLLLTTTEEAYRGRVSGARMLAVYGLPVGLIAGGFLIEAFGTHATFTAYSVSGACGTLAIAFLRPGLWRS